jgi:hypothetical protein
VNKDASATNKANASSTLLLESRSPAPFGHIVDLETIRSSAVEKTSANRIEHVLIHSHHKWFDEPCSHTAKARPTYFPLIKILTSVFRMNLLSSLHVLLQRSAVRLAVGRSQPYQQNALVPYGHHPPAAATPWSFASLVLVWMLVTINYSFFRWWICKSWRPNNVTVECNLPLPVGEIADLPHGAGLFILDGPFGLEERAIHVV